MRKIPTNPTLSGDSLSLARRLTDLWSVLASTLNDLVDKSEVSATSSPTAGVHKLGEFVRNANPLELGTAGSKYIISGWICTAAGTPGTWLQARVLTGN